MDDREVRSAGVYARIRRPIRRIVAAGLGVLLLVSAPAAPVEAATPKTKLVSRTSEGDPGNGDSSPFGRPSVSANGRYLAFGSRAANFPGGDGSTVLVYVHDRKTRTTSLVSKTSGGDKANGTSSGASISATGRFVAFSSVAANLPGGDGSTLLVYVHDRKTGRTKLVSRTSGGPKANGDSFAGAGAGDISANGRFVAFSSVAANLPGGDGSTTLVYVHDRKTGRTNLVSRTSGGARANGDSGGGAISGNGRYIVINSVAANLPGGDGSTFLVYVHDRQTGRTKLVSRRSNGPKANGDSRLPDLSADGRLVTFDSEATNLPGGGSSTRQVYVHDRQTGKTKLVSRRSNGPKANGDSIFPGISANGRHVAFRSNAGNLPAGNGTTLQVYRRGPL